MTATQPRVHLDAAAGLDRHGRSARERARTRRALLTLGGLVGLALLAACMYQFWKVVGDWDYTMDLRRRQLAALAVVGAAIGMSSLMFQTIAGSRILTPGVMGFDVMYMFVQTLLVFYLGGDAALRLGVGTRATLNMAVMCGFALLLFGWLFRKHSRNLVVTVLAGMVLSGLFASLTSFASRMLTPNDFQSLQDVMFASFSTVDAQLLAVVSAITAVATIAAAGLLRSLNVVALGHEQAVVLGLNYHRIVRLSLVVITVMVAAATALVGPMLFLGLIVANLARQLIPSSDHRILVPAAAVVGVITCVLGQLLVLRVFDFAAPFAVIVNLVGGVYFLWLMTRTVQL